jgi:DNA-binding transcriptional MerR regulator
MSEAAADQRRSAGKSKNAFRTISEVASELDVPQHVLRFWETKFSQIKPMKRGGGRRYYRPEDIDVLKVIQHHLYTNGYTIRGVQNLFRQQGVKATIEAWRNNGAAPGAAAPAAAKMADNPAPGAASKPKDDASVAIIAAVLEELKALRRSLDG